MTEKMVPLDQAQEWFKMNLRDLLLRSQSKVKHKKRHGRIYVDINTLLKYNEVNTKGENGKT